MDIGRLIADRRKELGLTLEQVGDAVGVGKSTVKKWESGCIANMRRDKIGRLAAVLQLDAGELIAGEADGALPPVRNIRPLPRRRRVPILGRIACGEPIFAEETRESFMEVEEGLDADFCLIACGDSMIGARIMDGDVVFIHRQAEVENGEIAAVIIEDEATLKRVYYFPEQEKIVLSAENAKYPPFVFSGEELSQIRILGKAVAFQSYLH